MKYPSKLTLIVTWNAVRALWMFLIVYSDLMVLARSGDPGVYGILPDWKLIFVVCALPVQTASTIIYMEAGRKAALAVEALSTTVYCLITIGLWRGISLVRRLAIGFYSIELLILGFFVIYIVPSLWGIYLPTLRFFSLGTSLLFIGIDGWILRALLGSDVKSQFRPTDRPLQTNIVS